MKYRLSDLFRLGFTGTKTIPLGRNAQMQALLAKSPPLKPARRTQERKLIVPAKTGIERTLGEMQPF